MTGLTTHVQKLIFNMMMIRWKYDFVIFVDFMWNEVKPIVFNFGSLTGEERIYYKKHLYCW